jgi:hypothetical protein
VKRTPLKKKSKQSISVIQRRLWELCRKIAYNEFKDADGHISCFTCRKPRIEASNRQLGHFLPKGACGAYLKYDLRNLRWQCYHCNINMGGAGAEFYKRLVEEHGQEFIDGIFKDKQILVKAEDHYLMLIDQYTEKLKTA